MPPSSPGTKEKTSRDSASKEAAAAFLEFPVKLWRLTGTVGGEEPGGWNWGRNREQAGPGKPPAQDQLRMEKEWGGGSGMHSVVASLNDTTPEKEEHLWVSRPAVLKLRGYLCSSLGPPTVSRASTWVAALLLRNGDLRCDQPSPSPRKPILPRTWGWIHGQRKGTLFQRNLAVL